MLIPISCSISPSPNPIPFNFNGWDDLELYPPNPIYINPIRSLLISSGLDDSKLAFAFSLGFLSALAVSKVRFSSMIVLPVSVLVFVIGVAAWVARIKVRVYNEKVRDLERFLRGLGSELEKGANFSFEQFDRSKIEGYLEAIDSVKKNVESSVVGEILNGHLDFDLGETRRGNVKSGKKRKEFDFVRYLAELFQENVIGVKAPKVRDATEKLSSGVRTNSAVVASESESGFDNQKEYQENDWSKESKSISNRNLGKIKEKKEDQVKAFKTVLRDENSSRTISDFTKIRNSQRSRLWSDQLSYEGEQNELNRNSQFTSKQESFQRRVFKQNYERRSIQRDVGPYNHPDTNRRTAERTDFFTAESEGSSILEESLKISNGTYSPLGNSKTKESRLRSGDLPVETTQPVYGTEESNKPLSLTVSVDDQFSQHMQDATNLLKQARECMRRQDNEETMDSILHESARLFSAAESMRPMSLLAVGQLGNTYLLHGELKLKISRELRTLLLRSEASLSKKVRPVYFKKLHSHDLTREDVESTLVEVCEECEVLLVEAGRKYKTALSIDGNDVRSLYNWGLALSYRAQLIADIGPEAAVDADKIYLAAIDKFDAMMSRSNLYATDALYRWGMVLQQRSYLRPRNNREKIKLLHQAKSLFEDVLSMESDKLQVREALVSCVSELNYNEQW